MTLTTSPAALDAPALLRLPPDLRLTPEQFALVCAENREAVLELDADGRVIAITPTGSETGSRNGELCFQLKLYAKRAGGCPPSAWSGSRRWRPRRTSQGYPSSWPKSGRGKAPGPVLSTAQASGLASGLRLPPASRQPFLAKLAKC